MRKRLLAAAVLAAAAFTASCSDSAPNHSLPTSPQARGDRVGTGPAPGTCVSPNVLWQDVDAVEPAGTARTAMHTNVSQMQSAVAARNYVLGHGLAFGIAGSVIKQFKSHSLIGTPAQAVQFVNDVFCYSGLSLTVTDLSNTDVILPTDPARVITNSDGTGGTSVPPGVVTEPTLIKFALIPDTFGGAGHGPLHTKLDQYPTFLSITSFSETGAPLAKPAIVAVCPPPGIDPIIRARLRLGHDATAGFEITPAADGGFLSCATSFGAAPSVVDRWLTRLASLVAPRNAYARTTMLAAGGIGGTAGEFSPFDAIDPDVSFRSGGVGGTAGEFTIEPRVPAPKLPVGPMRPSSPSNNRLVPRGPSMTAVGDVCTAVATEPGGELEQPCSPAVFLSTHLGTKLTSVPITWVVIAGGGVIAPASTTPSWSCGTFAPTATNLTGVAGEARLCWRLGPTAGTNQVRATPGIGGDVPLGVTFEPASGVFTAEALLKTPAASATGLTVAYDHAAHTGSGTCSDGLTPALSYKLGTAPLASAPVNPGSYTLTVTCGDGGVRYATVTATAPIVITFGLVEGFEVESGWATTGLWHRSTLRRDGHPIVNTLYPTYVDGFQNEPVRGALPAPFAGTWAAWYGTESSGNYIGVQIARDPPHSGGTSTAPNAGTITSPPIAIPSVSGKSITLRFNTWWEIDAVHPSIHDLMRVSVFDVDAHTTTPLPLLNPPFDVSFAHAASIGYTSRGFASAPAWIEAVRDLSAFKGKTIRLIYSFDTVDSVANGFRGFIIDNVRVTQTP